jgi:hypothetical protein
MPPTFKSSVPIYKDGHGWIGFSLDGEYSWNHTPLVISPLTKQVIATLKDEDGFPVSSTKYIEVHLRDGKVVNMGDQFALGRKGMM